MSTAGSAEPDLSLVSGAVAITGATGFIGRRLLAALTHDGVTCRIIPTRGSNGGYPSQPFADRAETIEHLAGISTVFHCAGFAHAMGVGDSRLAARHWEVNFEATRRLVNAAGEAGVRAFVFLSSVKAMGEPGQCCVDEDWPAPPDSPYGHAKRAAEAAVQEAGRRYGMHVVNLRLSMVYGAGGRGNLERMGRWLQLGFFPPLPETGNRRSMVHVSDVIDAMRLVASDPRANGETFIVAGPEAPSGSELQAVMRRVLGLPPSRWAVPAVFLRAAGRLGNALVALGIRGWPLNRETVRRLLDSACYSPERIAKLLGWRAKVSMEAGLREMFGK